MQDPLKTNKPFKAAYNATVQGRHNKFLTPDNIDDLILRLSHMETDRSRMRRISSPPGAPIICNNNTGDGLFADKFVQAISSKASHNNAVTGPSGAGVELKGLESYRQWTNNQQSGCSTWRGEANYSKRFVRLAPIDTSQLMGTSNSLQSPATTKDASKRYSTVPLVNSINKKAKDDHDLTTVSANRSKTVENTAAGQGNKHTNNLLNFVSSPCKPKYESSHNEYPDSSIDESMMNEESVANEQWSDDGRDSGWTDSDQWPCEEEEEDISDIDDDDDTRTSIMTSNASETIIDGMESDETLDLEDELNTADELDVTPPSLEMHKDASAPVAGATRWTSPTRSYGCISTLAISPRTFNVGERGADQATPPLTPSLFPGRSPTIHFPLANETYKSLRSDQRALLKWKMSSITPNVVRRVISRVGFKPTNGSRWIGYWGKHMKSEAFRTVAHDQKVNHFPGSFNLGRKDKLWRNLFKMQAQFGKKEFDFIPETFILPSDIRNLKRVWDNPGYKNTKWIIKPPASARGIGIKVINKWSQIPKKRSVVIQRYISNPFLINGSKFDLRVYVYVTSFDPLIIYIYRDGLVRFATEKYSKSIKKLSNRYMHLTNYSVNKHSSQFVSNSDETQCYGHKWGLLALWGYLSTSLSIDPGPVWERIKDVVIKTIISCEGTVSSLIKANVRNNWSVHELFGFDIMLDRQLKPWLLEVNVSPSLHSNSSLDVNIKEVMMRDIFNMSRFTLPTSSTQNERPAGLFSSHSGLTSEEKMKHSKFTNSKKVQHQQVEAARILDQLSADDCNILMNLEDEVSIKNLISLLKLSSYSLPYCLFVWAGYAICTGRTVQ